MKINKKKTNSKPPPSDLHGIAKWIKNYRERLSIDLQQLEQTSRASLASKNFQTNSEFQSNTNQTSDDEDSGWTVVSHTLKKTRQRMVPSTEKSLNRLRAKQKASSEKKELRNFYKFQMTDKKVDQLEQLKMKFELDKQRILQMRQQRKFKPF